VLLVAGTLLRVLLEFGGPAAALSREPLTNGDYAFQAYHAALGVRFLAEHGSTSGYDPGFLAGYVKSPHFSASVVPFEVAALATGDAVRGAKLVALATPLIWVAGIALLAAGFGASPRAVRLATLAGALVFWLSMPFLFLVLGMAGFLIACGLAFAATGALARGLAGRGWAPFALLAPAAVLAHPHGLLLTGLFAAPLLCVEGTARARTRVVAGLGIVLASLPFLIPYFAFADRVDRTAQSDFWVLARPLEPFIYYFNREEGARQAGLLEAALLCAAAVGFRRWRADGHGRRAAGYATALVALAALTFYGGAFPVTAALQPLRLTVAIAGFSIAPAAPALAAAWDGHRTARLALGAAAAALVALALYSGSLRALFHVGLDRDERALVSWVRSAPPGRVLIEDSVHGGALGGGDLDAGRVVPLLPLWTGRAILGGPTADVYLAARTAHATDGRAFGRPARELADLDALLDRYAVSALAVWSVDLFDRVRALPSCQPAGRIGRLVLFTRRSAGWALAGRADVAATPGLLEVTAAAPPASGPLVLAFHFDRVLRVEPPARLVPVPLPGDPVPFLGVEAAPPHFTIRTW